jgi:hypothetical protein
MMAMSKQHRNEASSRKPNKPLGAADTIIDGKRVSEMTSDELIEAMRQIVDELDRRNPKSKRSM